MTGWHPLSFPQRAPGKLTGRHPIAALASDAGTLDAGPFEVDPSGWSGLAISAAAIASLASFLATAERGVAARPTAPVLDPEIANTGDPLDPADRPAAPPRQDGSGPACSTRSRPAGPAGPAGARFWTR